MPEPAPAARLPEAPALYSSRTLKPRGVSKPRLLLVGEAALTARWRAALDWQAVEIVSVAAGAELTAACAQEFTLAVVDVAPAQLPDVLRTLRAREAQGGAPILVAAEGIVTEPELAGVLPRYRAMACGRQDLLQLARRQLVPAPQAARARKIL